ncbi:MAG: Pr6Pr family membrane protein [Vicinamibacterales bacterium]
MRDAMAAVLAVTAWSAVLLQLWLSVGLGLANGRSVVEGVLVYLGYFTVLTNIFVALVLTARLVPSAWTGRRPLSHPQAAACAACSIALVGLGYHALLREVWDPQGLQWLADVMLHYVVPAAYCAFWLLVIPAPALPWWSPLAWSAYPLAYFAYALARGAVFGTYPYPFIDVTAIGYGQALANAAGLLSGFVVVGWLFLLLQRGVRRAGGVPAD